jgi:hypothetical protein
MSALRSGCAISKRSRTDIGLEPMFVLTPFDGESRYNALPFDPRGGLVDAAAPRESPARSAYGW